MNLIQLSNILIETIYSIPRYLVGVLLLFCMHLQISCSNRISNFATMAKQDSLIVLCYYDTIGKQNISTQEKQIDSKITIAKSNKNNYAIAKWLFIKTFNKFYTQGIIDSQSNNEAIKIASANNFVSIFAEAQNFKSVRLFESQQYAQAFNGFMKIQQIAEENPKQTIVTDYAIWHSVAACYFKFGDYEHVKNILTSKINYQQIKDPFFNFQVSNTLGMCYDGLGKFDSANYFFKRGMQIGIDTKDSSRIAVAMGNIGKIEIKQGHFQSALPKLLLDIRLSQKYLDTNNATTTTLLLIEKHIEQKKYTEANKFLQQISRWVLSYGSFTQLKNYYTNSSMLLRQYGKHVTAFDYADSAKYYTQMEQQQLDIQILIKAQNKIYESTRQYEAKLRLAKEKKEAIVRYSALFIFTLSMLAILLFMNWHRIKLKITANEITAKNNLLEIEKQKLDLELSIANQNLIEFTNGIVAKNKLIEEFTLQLNELKQQATSSANLSNVELKTQQLIESQILTEEQWQNFKQLFESVHKGFFLKITQLFPELTTAEIRYLAISKLKITTKEVANMLGISPDTITKTRYRINKKYVNTDGHNPLTWTEQY